MRWGPKWCLTIVSKDTAQGGVVAFHDSSGAHKYVLGKNVYQRGVVHFKLKLESFTSRNWMMIGVAKADVVQYNNDQSYKWPGSYGWDIGSSGQIHVNGSYSSNNAKLNCSQGDIVELSIDCDASKLSLHLPSSQKLDMQLPESQTWMLHVNLHGSDDRIRIL